MQLTGKVATAVSKTLPPNDTRVIGEARTGADYLITYVTGRSCGLLAVRPDDPQPVTLQITAAWPHDVSQGSNRLPGGPYLSASGKTAASTTFASLYCGAKSLVVEYSAPDPAPPTTQSGPVSLLAPRSAGSPLIVSVGSADIRRDVIAHYTASTQATPPTRS